MSCGHTVFRGQLNDPSVEHDVGQHRAHDAACNLNHAVGQQIRTADSGVGAPSQPPVHQRYDGIEVCTGDRPEQQNQYREAENGSRRVLQQLQTDIAR
jgi:hypothetical protein